MLTCYSSTTIALLLAVVVGQARAWGVVGHQVVGTIANIHLHESTRAVVSQLVPYYAKGHLAPIAAWADRIRGIPDWRWSGELHYTSPTWDHPPDTCYFGERGFKTDHDILHAVSNYTQRLADNPDDFIALRFLVHFVGDVHQPLHLTSRERGGNGDPVIFEGRRMSLHGLWDTGLITKAVREQRNYTRRLPSPQIERDLVGSIYDPYIRFILWEGVRVWWRNSFHEWFDCTEPSLSRRLISGAQHFFGLERVAPSAGLCPMKWAKETHETTCSTVYPIDYNYTAPPREFNTPEYYKPIRDSHIIEKLLAQAGLRLAVILNDVLGNTSTTTSDQQSLASLNLAWLDQ